MKKLLLLFVFGLNPLLSLSQESNRGPFFEIDGSYWEKSINHPQFIAPEKNRFGGVRVFFGLPIGQNWAIGLLGSHQSYYEEQARGYQNREIYGHDPNESGNSILLGYTQDELNVGLQNELVGWGLFLQRKVKLGTRTSLNFNLYAMRESGKNGQLEIFPDYTYLAWWPCPNCLSIAPGPITRSVQERNWKSGIDLAFVWALSKKLDLGIRANFLEFRKRTISTNSGEINTLVFDPLQALADGYAGDRYDFGSAVGREGVRISLTFRPF